MLPLQASIIPIVVSLFPPNLQMATFLPPKPFQVAEFFWVIQYQEDSNNPSKSIMASSNPLQLHFLKLVLKLMRTININPFKIILLVVHYASEIFLHFSLKLLLFYTKILGLSMLYREYLREINFPFVINLFQP